MAHVHRHPLRVSARVPTCRSDVSISRWQDNSVLGAGPLSAATVEALHALGRQGVSHCADVTPHLRGATHSQIVLPQCDMCGRTHWYPALRCPWCGSLEWPWHGFGSDGLLNSWTVIRHPVAVELRSQVPFVIGLVCPVKAPDVRLVSALAVTPDTPLRIGLSMTALPGPAVDGGHLLVFAPAEEASE
jgi:uncharacterized protein